MNYVKKLNSFSDKRGKLFPMEFGELPFVPKRMFYVQDVPKNTIRGEHAHYITKQLLICVCGEILVGLFDGKKTNEIILKKGESILVNNMIWDYQKFMTGDDVLLVLCSTPFDKTDYIDDKEKFTKIVGDL